VGLPVALYGDGINILVRNDRHWTLDEQLAGTQAPTHVGRMRQDLGIGYVQARSPQGKGRVERLWGTLPGSTGQRTPPARRRHARGGQCVPVDVPERLQWPLRAAGGQSAGRLAPGAARSGAGAQLPLSPRGGG